MLERLNMQLQLLLPRSIVDLAKDLPVDLATIILILFGILLLVSGIALYVVFSDERNSPDGKIVDRKAVQQARKLVKTKPVEGAIELWYAERYQEATAILEEQDAIKELSVLYSEIADWAKAAEYASKAGEHSNASVWFEEANRMAPAAKSAVAAGEFSRAIRLFLDQGKGVEAAKTARLLLKGFAKGMSPNLSGEMKQTAWSPVLDAARSAEQWLAVRDVAGFLLRWDDVALALEELEDHEQAVRMYRKARKFKEAGRLLEEMGRPAEAELDYAEFEELQENWSAAAQHHLKGGQSRKAAELLLRCEEYAEAAEIMANLGEFEQSAELYEKVEDWKLAGHNYLQAGQHLKAADALAQAGDFARAANLYLDHEKFRDAGLLFQKLEDIEKATQAFQQHLRAVPDDAEITVLLAELLEQQDLFNSAAETYTALIGGRPVSDANIEHYYKYARLLERTHKLPQARLNYEKILAFDLAYEDVPQRIGALKQKEVLSEIAGGNDQDSGRNRYRVERELGKGGMGAVFLANDTILGRNVALKVLKTADLGQDSVQRLLEEARISAQLNHENIVTVFDVSLQGGNLYLSMEYVEGSTLSDVIREQGVLGGTATLLIFGQAAMALNYAHGKGVIHRDIKPSNLMWTPDKKLKVMDFGLAVAMHEMQSVHTVAAGTPHYMSPEQVMGDTVDQRSDIYAVGVSMYECLIGDKPYSGGDVGYHHVHSPVPELPNVQPEIAGIVQKCMAKKKEDRYPDAAALLDDIRTVLKHIAAQNKGT